MPEPTLSHLADMLRIFRDARDWAPFHTLKDLASAISIEAAELQEHFLWRPVEDQAGVLVEKRTEIEAELADVVIQALNFALAADIDLAQAIVSKIEANAERYPVEKARGSAAKYTDL